MTARAVPLVVALFVVACSSAPGEPSSGVAVNGPASPSAAPTLAVSVEEASEAPAGAIEILLTFGPKFEPEEATADAGTVVFFLRNDPGDGPPALHNFLLGRTMDSPLAVSPTLATNEAVTFTVEGLMPGTYTYWCTVPSPDGAPHAQYGMVGTLTVRQ